MDTTIIPNRGKLISEEAYEKILEIIIKENNVQGGVLGERILTERCGLGKAPVREALIRLCAEGFLTSIPRYGYVINPLKESEYVTILKMRVFLEQEALKKSFSRIGDAELSALAQKDQFVERAEAEEWGVWEVWDANCSFHLMLASYSDDDILRRFLEQSLRIEKRFFAQKVWKAKQKFQFHMKNMPHGEICAEIKARNLARALEKLKQDIMNGNELPEG